MYTNFNIMTRFEIFLKLCKHYFHLLVAKSHFMVVIEVLVQCLLVDALSYLGSFSHSGNLLKQIQLNIIL